MKKQKLSGLEIYRSERKPLAPPTKVHKGKKRYSRKRAKAQFKKEIREYFP